MTSPAQKRAVANHRSKMAEQGMSRLELRVPEADRDLVRSVAQLLRGAPDEAEKTRNALRALLPEASDTKGRILTAMRSSALYGDDLVIERLPSSERDIEL